MHAYSEYYVLPLCKIIINPDSVNLPNWINEIALYIDIIQNDSSINKQSIEYKVFYDFTDTWSTESILKDIQQDITNNIITDVHNFTITTELISKVYNYSQKLEKYCLQIWKSVNPISIDSIKKDLYLVFN